MQQFVCNNSISPKQWAEFTKTIFSWSSDTLQVPESDWYFDIGQKFFDSVIDKVYWYYASNYNNILLHIDSYWCWIRIIIFLY